MDYKVKCVAIDYEEWQIFGTVWRYDDYKKLLNLLLLDNKVILGGDILVCNNDGDKRLSYAYSGCNWYYEGDSPIESNITAQKYLSSLDKWASREKLFITLSLK